MNYLCHIAILTANKNTAVVSLLTEYVQNKLQTPTHNLTFVLTQRQLRELGASFLREADLMDTLPSVKIEYAQLEIQP